MLIFGGVIALGAIMLSSIASEYNNQGIVDEDFSNRYNKIDEFTGEINSSLSALQDDPGIIGTTTILFKATYAFINFLLNTLGFISEPTTNFMNDFDMPYQVGSIIFTISLSIITDTIISTISTRLRVGSSCASIWIPM